MHSISYRRYLGPVCICAVCTVALQFYIYVALAHVHMSRDSCCIAVLLTQYCSILHFECASCTKQVTARDSSKQHRCNGKLCCAVVIYSRHAQLVRYSISARQKYTTTNTTARYSVKTAAAATYYTTHYQYTTAFSITNSSSRSNNQQ
jgi:hypothetical protein